MKIRNQFRLIAILPLLMASIFGLSDWYGENHLAELRNNADIFDHLRQGIERIESNSYEYISDRRERAHQWTLKAFAETEGAIRKAALAYAQPRDRELIQEISARLDQARWSFDEYGKFLHGDLNSIQREYAQDVSQRMRIELRSIKPLSFQLHENAHADIAAFSRRFSLVMLALLTGTALGVLLLTFPLLYRINTSIQALTRATFEMSRGKLRRKVELSGHDELSRLAEDFNSMALQLEKADKAQRNYTHRLETANRDLESFSYSVSHDLRAPLRAIDGFIAILRDEHTDKLDGDASRLFDIISDNARKMGELIDDILTLSRAGRLELSYSPVDMNALVDTVWDELKTQHKERAIEFIRSDLPPAKCDPRAIRQVWQNLLDNAIKFTGKNEYAVIEVSATRDEARTYYQIDDNGAGFNQEYANKLFALFQRLHGMDEYEGTGVGLAIIKRLIQKHHGEIQGHGKEGEGAHFVFSLPHEIPANL